MKSEIRIRRISAAELNDHRVSRLAEILIECVQGGASVSFLSPLPRERAVDYWRRVSKELSRNDRILLVAEDRTGRTVGSIQMVHMPSENQPHMAQVTKVLVEKDARGRGVGRRLLSAVTELARRERKTLLVLSTATGSVAEQLYHSEGWQRIGVVPGCVLMADGKHAAATFFYKQL
ncbi:MULTISPECIES: GNAT family N-acetyltransferase [Bradyrhizobium]|uniref:GNAT family N-acetyltransferase n=1 Tax=Bradyrhizobium septentrionale TaxID=1404411 RepID=A0A974A546_9BRAD|nr:MULTISPECIES: GNAT family N-acetyltransferase [Bradyrhizobium]MCK7672949.1 GNAT family N-acetyltransferase [Bradyrhizobium sp. 2S1]QIG94545.1 GNAT family N-acetyltransferase [Bradyrhizobium sp. 6(2017)]UGY17057.1 GNAT family N-acetyltransferase [Bradyrhizobium septentrionale]UGY25801.1 GNAT family N-acetyltransferase [Bradyrhizobium septentrionale]